MFDYPLATTSWDEKEVEAINDVIDSGFYTMGKGVASFETAYAKYVGSKYALMVNSGSSANLLAVASLFYKKERPLKAGDEVIVPAVSWSTTYYPLHQYGLKLVFVDIDKDTMNFDLDQLESAISDNTRLIFSVDLLGNMNDYAKINSLIEGRDIYLLEDSCESMGAEFQSQRAGTYGIIGTFSTFFSHHIATMEGGILVTDDEELYQIMFSMRAHGWTRGLPQNNHVINKSEDDFYEAFNFVLPGYNVRPVEMSGAIGLRQLEKLPSFITARRQNAEYFLKEFSDLEYVSVQTEIGKSSWFGFAILIEEGAPFSRNQLVKAFKGKKIECRPVVSGNFTRNSVVKYFDYKVSGSLTNADAIHDRGIFVGNHPYDISSNLLLVAQIIRELSK